MSNKADLRIAISGKSGCGNSTVSKLVAEKLGLRVINYTFKNLARDSGMTFEELAQKAEKDPQYDLKIDRMQVELAREGGCVLGSRLAIWLRARCWPTPAPPATARSAPTSRSSHNLSSACSRAVASSAI